MSWQELEASGRHQQLRGGPGPSHVPTGAGAAGGTGRGGRVSVCLSLPATPGETGVGCCLGDVICHLEKTTQGHPAASHMWGPGL